MDDILYLDTARIGRMSPAARRASTDFLALVGEEGTSAYFERFLRAGLAECPGRMRDRYPGLSGWAGVSPLRRSLRALAGSRPDLPVLLANRSAQLMKLAARLLFRPCTNVLATDLDWPGYQHILRTEAARSAARVNVVPLREQVLEQKATADEVVDAVCRAYASQGCDGLFLTAVNNLGVRLPVERIVRQLEATRPARFVVVDGAQDFCHASANLREEYCDFYLAGCHKFLRAYHPLGLGFYGRRRSRGFIETTLGQLTTSGEIDDPLLHYVRQLDSPRRDGYTETVSLGPLFACQGAAGDECVSPDYRPAFLSARLQNLDAIAVSAAGAGWQPLVPDAGLRSGILVARAARPTTRGIDGATLRAKFRDHGVGLTAYDGGLIRVSMPESPLTDEEFSRIRTALASVA